ncbi:MAG: hypothetical protein LQ350_006000 [Teloschistes chrysophthalmus]|nr:MAG: hypothetical protein LQ350_006000 [Niorma chrysophthalma]
MLDRRCLTVGLPPFSHPVPWLKPSGKVPRATRFWHREHEWESGPRAERLWEQLVPGKTGLILIKDPAKYGLESGLETEVDNAGVYTLNGAHQSHCLKLIREALTTVMSGNVTALTEGAATADGKIHESKALSHAFHCVDYLRQTIMCNADTTVEWEAKDVGESGHSGHINGYGVPRRCRN